MGVNDRKSRYTGGKAQKKNTNNGRSNGNERTKKKIEDFVYYLGSAKQATDYEETTEFVINYIKKEYNSGLDIATALKELQPCDTDGWMPDLNPVTETDTAKKEAQEKKNEIIFKARFEEYRARVQTYKENLVKAYALLWERCTKGMKNKIAARTDFAKIENDPIELLKAIKEHSLNYQEHRYPASVVYDALITLIGVKQKEGESLSDYTRRFRTARDVFESHLGGPIIWSKHAKSMKDYNENDEHAVEKCQSKAADQLMTYLYLENADKSKYGSLLKGLSMQYSLQNDQYPKSIVKASDVLSNHRFDSGFGKNKAKKDHRDSEKANKKDEGDTEVNLSFLQMEGKCYCCGKAGHRSPKCREKDKPREEWAINKARAAEQSHAQAGETNEVNSNNDGVNSNKADIESKKTVKSVAWTGTHADFSFVQTDEMREWILLDNQSTATIFCNPDLVENIRPARNEILALKTNGGVLHTDTKATLDKWGDVWFNPKAVTNIFSYAEMADRYRITYDSGDDDAFVVHTPWKDVRFERHESGLYVHMPFKKKRDQTEGVQCLTTVEENKEFYTERQYEKAKRARDMFHALGTPSVDDFRAAIRMNMISNNKVTLEDIKIAEKIFGPDIGALKGKTTRRKPAPVVANQIEIPNELVAAQRDVTLCVDGMKVNGLDFFTTISKNLYYRTATYVANKNPETYKERIGEVIRVYRSAEFNVSEIRADNEFRPLMGPIQDEFEAAMNFANPQEHVPEAERNNRTIQERIRATYHRLPYTELPRIMVQILVSESARKLNYFPAKHGISKTYSPRMIMHHRNLDYDKDCKHAFGSYVQAHDEPSITNTNATRTKDCIYLRPVFSHQGGHELLHLQTNSIITRRKVTQMPITPHIIKQVHALAQQDGMPKGLKIANRTGLILFDSSLIAGVDYDEELFNDPDYDSEEQSDDEDDDDSNDEYDEMDADEIAALATENANDESDDDEKSHKNNDDDEDSNGESDGEYDGEQNELDADAHDEVQSDDDDESKDETTQEANPTTVEEEKQQDNLEDETPRTRYGRAVKPNAKYYNEGYTYSQFQDDSNHTNKFEYTENEAKVMATIICAMNAGVEVKSVKHGVQLVQTYSYKKGLKKYGKLAKQAGTKEMRQLHDRLAWEPINIENLTDQERRRAMETLMFIAEKRDGTVKARTVANGSTQRAYMDRDEAASPTTMTDSVMITSAIDAYEERDVMVADVPNAFIQTTVETKKRGERIVVKIRGPLVDLLLEIAPEVYGDYVVYERGGEKILYCEVQKALYGMMDSSLLYYKKFVKDIKEIGFELNPYDQCVANRTVNGKQHTITWHVDDLKSSHVDKRVNDEFHKWLTKKYASDGVGEVKVTRGQRHDYLAMILDFSERKKLKIDMRYYIKGMVEDFSVELPGKTKCPWTDQLFRVDEKSTLLDDKRAKEFHTFVMKGMFLCKRARQDIQPGIAFLSTRVTAPIEQDWNKLVRLMDFLKTTQEDIAGITVENGIMKIVWHVDAAFAIHPDMKSHTGSTMTMGNGVITSMSTKQKVNSRSSTEAELNGMDDIISKILWTKYFIEAQGYPVKENIVLRDNQSTMKLEENGKASSGKRTRHFNIRLFYVTDLIKRQELTIEYCPTDEMVSDYMSKPTTGAKFIKFRDKIMGWG